MISIQQIVLARAQEQVSRRGAEIIRNPNWAAAKRPKSRTARELKCVCGDCRICRNREAMRARRDVKPRRKGGPSMSLGKRCACGRPIANCNRTGMCALCRHRDWCAKRQARVAAARGIAA
jgi:hypothetical protein